MRTALTVKVTIPQVDRFMSGLTLRLTLKRVVVRRLEVSTGVGGRRRWSPDDEARIAEERLGLDGPGRTSTSPVEAEQVEPVALMARDDAHNKGLHVIRFRLPSADQASGSAQSRPLLATIARLCRSSRDSPDI